jgi:cell division protein FtsB
MSDLVARLRSPAAAFYEYAADGGALLREAADHIAALEAEAERLRQRNRELEAEVANWRHIMRDDSAILEEA